MKSSDQQEENKSFSSCTRLKRSIFWLSLLENNSRVGNISKMTFYLHDSTLLGKLLKLDENGFRTGKKD